MSHVAKINLEIHDLEALAATAKALGMEFVRNQKTYKWYEGQGTCEHALRVKAGTRRGYEIGIVRRAGKPGYEPVWDDFDTQLLNIVGRGACKLKQEYALQVGSRWAQKQGLRVTRTRKENGVVVLRAT